MARIRAQPPVLEYGPPRQIEFASLSVACHARVSSVRTTDFPLGNVLRYGCFLLQGKTRRDFTHGTIHHGRQQRAGRNILQYVALRCAHHITVMTRSAVLRVQLTTHRFCFGV